MYFVTFDGRKQNTRRVPPRPGEYGWVVSVTPTPDDKYNIRNVYAVDVHETRTLLVRKRNEKKRSEPDPKRCGYVRLRSSIFAFIAAADAVVPYRPVPEIGSSPTSPGWIVGGGGGNDDFSKKTVRRDERSRNANSFTFRLLRTPRERQKPFPVGVGANV